MKPKSRILSLLLAICLVVGLMPTTAFAAEGDKPVTPELSEKYFQKIVAALEKQLGAQLR